MALLWMDGFDTYGTSGNSSNAIISAAGYSNVTRANVRGSTRTGFGTALEITRGSGAQQVGRCTRAFETADECIVGVAVKVQPSDFTRFLNLQYDNLLGTVRSQIGLARNALSGISILGYNDSGYHLLGATAPNTFFGNVWHYVELKYKPGPGGYIVLAVDGANVASLPAYVRPNNPALVNVVEMIANPGDYSIPFGNTDNHYDDLYICNGEGATFNDFIGDVVIHGLLPASDAGPNDMAPFGGGLANYTTVDDNPPDDDLSYLWSNTMGHQDFFGVDPLPANVIDVLAVSAHARAKKDAAGTSNIKLGLRLNTNEVWSGTKTLTTAYTNKHHIFEAAPDESAWSRAKALATHLAIEIA